VFYSLAGAQVHPSRPPSCVSRGNPALFLVAGIALASVEGITFRASGLLGPHALGAYLDLVEGTVVLAIMAAGIHGATNAGIGIL